MLPGHRHDEKGLLVREVGDWSREKAHDAFSYADLVSVAMSDKGPIWWIELFAGPGRLWDKAAEQYCPGSPLEALQVERPFTGYSFADLEKECTSALHQRIGDRDNVYVITGNANDPAHLARLAAPIPTNALVLAYLDPEGLELHFNTIRFLAKRFYKLDLLLNTGIHYVDRAISAEIATGIKQPMLRPMLDHPNPVELFRTGVSTHEAIRSHFKTKFAELGFRPPVASAIRTSRGVPMYDFSLISRNPKADELYRNATQRRRGGQGRFKLHV